METNGNISSQPADPITYEVVWGCGERERTARVDYRDGSAISSGAEMRATKVFLDMMACGGPVGFYVNGELQSGSQPTCDECTTPVIEHSTRTYQRRIGERYITKSNGSCGRWRPEYETTWVCSCGNGGFGHDRDDAHHRRRSDRRKSRNAHGQHGAP